MAASTCDTYELSKVGEIESGEKAKTLFTLIKAGIPVPPAFIISNQIYRTFKEAQQPDLPNSVWESIQNQIKSLESATNCKFGGSSSPLFLCCRGDYSSQISGMLPYVLNVGFNDVTVRALSKSTNSRAFAYSSYRLFIETYGRVVLRLQPQFFDDLVDEYMHSRGKKSTADFIDRDWIEVTKLFKSLIMRKTGSPFPQDVNAQLRQSILGIFAGFSSSSIAAYKSHFKLTSPNFSIIVMKSVFPTSQSSFSVCISSRDSEVGSSTPSGFVATGSPLEDLHRSICAPSAFGQSSPNFSEISKIASSIEAAFRSPQTIDIVSDGGLYVTRVKKTLFKGHSIFRSAKEMVDSTIISKKDAIAFIDPEEIGQLLPPKPEKVGAKQFCSGVASSSCLSKGILSFTVSDALEKSSKGESVILCRHRFLSEDFEAISKSKGFVCKEGNPLSHEAYICRLLRLPTAIGAEIKFEGKTIKCDTESLANGSEATITGDGELFVGALNSTPSLTFEDTNAEAIFQWSDQLRKGKISVYSIAESLDEVKASAKIGADGIGIFPMEALIQGKRAEVLASFIKSSNEKFIAPLEAQLAKDVAAVLTAGRHQMMTIQLLSAPLSHMLPDLATVEKELSELEASKEEEDFKEEKELKSKEALRDLIKSLRETNPRMGIRGTQMNFLNRRILKMQMTAIVTAVKELKSKKVNLDLRVLAPNAISTAELAAIKEMTDGEKILVGAGISAPRMCMTPSGSDFASIDSTELHQNAFGMAEGDNDSYLSKCLSEGKLIESPFAVVDRDGVGELIRSCVAGEKRTEIHGSNVIDQQSIKFCCQTGVASVVCPLALVPTARLCCAQAIISQ